MSLSKILKETDSGDMGPELFRPLNSLDPLNRIATISAPLLIMGILRWRMQEVKYSHK